MRRLGRRSLLRGAFGTALSLPLLEAMRPRRAQAAGPRRFVLVYCGIPPVGEEVDGKTGKPPQYVIPDAAGPLAAPFKVGLEPLETAGLRPDTAVISALRIPRTGSGNGRRYGASGFHYETMGPLVSGVSDLDGEDTRQAKGPSADWILAQAVGGGTRFPSLVYMVQAAAHSNYTLDYISFRPNPAAGKPYQTATLRNDPVVSPRVAFDQLFTGFSPSRGSTPPPPDPEIARRKDVLARVRGAYDGLRPRLGAADRQRLDEHIANVQALEKRVAALDLPPPPVPAGVCSVPSRPGPDPAAADGYANEDLRATTFVELVYQALACDLTRVVSLELTSSMTGVVLPTSLGITYRNYDGSPLPPPPLHEATHGQGNNLSVAECVRWHVKHVAALARKLKDTPDVTGTMLDSTAIVFLMEAGLGSSSLQGGNIVGESPPHTSEGMMALLVGGRNLGLTLGSHLAATGLHPASVSLTAMRAVAGASIANLGELTTEIPGLRA